MTEKTSFSTIFFMFIVLSALISFPRSHAENIPLVKSPLNLEDYFSLGTFFGSSMVGNRLTLQDGMTDGTWTSPIFISDKFTIWNHMEADANFDEFGLNLIQGGDAEDPLSINRWIFTNGGRPLRDCTRRHGGTCSFRLTTGLGSTNDAFHANVNYDSDEHATTLDNTFPFDNLALHYIFWVHTDIKNGEALPFFQFLTDQGGYYTNAGIWAPVPDIRIIPSTSTFTRFQLEYNMTEVNAPTDADLIYPYIFFGDMNPQGPQNTVWIDDILIFRDSRLKVQARTSSKDDCSQMTPWSDYRLLYSNKITPPAPVSRCIQIRLTLYRISGTNAANISGVNLSFSSAFDFTRPDFDRTSAIFTNPAEIAGIHGPVHNESGELIFQDGTPARFWGYQEGPLSSFTVSSPEDYADKICGNMAKYGFNIFKFLFEDDIEKNGGAAADLQNNLTNWYSRFMPRCNQYGVYYFLRFTPQLYLNDTLPQVYWAGGHMGPIYFTDQSVIDAYKDYLRIILNFEIDGVKIKDNPSVVFAELMNEESLLFGWRLSGLDGSFVGNEVGARELSPTWAGRLRVHFNEYVRTKYPTWTDLIIAWQIPGELLPFKTADGTCNAVTYTDPEQCNLTLIPFQEAGWKMYGNRSIDTMDYLIKREEDFYTQMRTFINEELESHIQVVGGKPLWNPWPSMLASSEVLGAMDYHWYEASAGHYGEDGHPEHWSIILSNTPRIPEWRYRGEKYLMRVKFIDKPLMIGEADYTPFSEYQAESIMYPVFATQFGVDGFIHFIYSKDYNDGRPGLMNPQNQAHTMAYAPTAIRLFLRGDISRPKNNIIINLSRNTSINYSSFQVKFPFFIGWIDPAYVLTSNFGWGSLNSKNEINVLPTLPQLVNSGSFTTDFAQRTITVNTSMTEGAFGNLERRSIVLKRLNFTLAGDQDILAYGVFLTSLDDLPLSSSAHYLLTLVGNAESSNMSWSTYHRQASKCTTCTAPSPFGEAPVWMANVEAAITIKTNNPIRIYPLNKLGAEDELTSFVVIPENGEADFTVGTYDTPWFSIRTLSCQDQEYDPDCDGFIIDAGLTLAINDWLQGTITMQRLIGFMEIWKQNLVEEQGPGG